MLIVGAKGFAKEVLEVLHQQNYSEDIVFYDDVNSDVPEFLYARFKVLKSFEEAENYFKTVVQGFTIGIGNPILRKKLSDKFINIGGLYASTISTGALISSFNVNIGEGSNILHGTIFSNDVKLGKGCIVYYNSIITHDCIVGDFVEISPSVTLLGRVQIGDYCQIGTNATVLPGIIIGRNVIVGAGSVVTKNIPDNCMVIGIPARIIKELTPLGF